jgi:UDP-N-acetyl-D-galactosamine dehydrogenase
MRKIALIGLGYVGLGLAVALNKENFVFGYDISKSRVEDLEKNNDRNLSVSQEDLAQSSIQFTSNIEDIRTANFYIVTVSTPAYFFELPNLDPLISATKDLAAIIKKDDIIVFESTSYPGTTEEICIPILEEISKMRCGVDFNVGYSPERINPADKEHSLKNVPKIISAQNDETLKAVAEVYKTCCDTVYPVSNMKTAEAVKILENTQRDVNIALMNEFAEIMHALKLNTHEIIEAAKTKWSFVPYKPGFVGGHCIAVDPHYLVFKAKRLGIIPDLILTARKVNDGITAFVTKELIRLLIKNNVNVNDSVIGIFGISYKANTPDIRNSVSLKLVKELRNMGLQLKVNDPMADKNLVKKKYDFELKDFEDMSGLTAAIITVDHDDYRSQGIEKFLAKLDNKPILMDIPNLFVEQINDFKHIDYWSL